MHGEDPGSIFGTNLWFPEAGQGCAQSEPREPPGMALPPRFWGFIFLSLWPCCQPLDTNSWGLPHGAHCPLL